MCLAKSFLNAMALPRPIFGGACVTWLRVMRTGVSTIDTRSEVQGTCMVNAGQTKHKDYKKQIGTEFGKQIGGSLLFSIF